MCHLFSCRTKNKELRKVKKHVLFAQYCFINVCVKKNSMTINYVNSWAIKFLLYSNYKLRPMQLSKYCSHILKISVFRKRKTRFSVIDFWPLRRVAWSPSASSWWPPCWPCPRPPSSPPSRSSNRRAGCGPGTCAALLLLLKFAARCL